MEWLQGNARGENGEKGDYSLLGVEFKFYKVWILGVGMVVMIVQHHIFNSSGFVHMVKMVNLYVFYHN